MSTKRGAYLEWDGVEVLISFAMYINNQEPKIEKCYENDIYVYSFVYEVTVYYCDCTHIFEHGVPFPLLIMVAMCVSSDSKIV